MKSSAVKNLIVANGENANPESAPTGTRAAFADGLTGNDRKVAQSIAYMMAHLDETLLVSKLAAVASVSPSHYFVLFKRRTGFAPIDFLIRLRMRKACELLRTTSLRVKEVAAALGYDDPFYFSRMFKAVNHLAPTAYRLCREPVAAVVPNTDPADGAAIEAASHDGGLFRSSPDRAAWNGEVRRGPGTWNDRILHENQNIIHSTEFDVCVTRK